MRVSSTIEDCAGVVERLPCGSVVWIKQEKLLGMSPTENRRAEEIEMFIVANFNVAIAVGAKRFLAGIYNDTMQSPLTPCR